jgi:hypothetical protein
VKTQERRARAARTLKTKNDAPAAARTLKTKNDASAAARAFKTKTKTIVPTHDRTKTKMILCETKM